MTTALDVSRLPAPTFVHPYDWEADIAALVSDLKERLPEWRGVFESDSFQKICQSWAWRLALKDVQHNRDARAMLLAYTTGADLDHIASTYHRTPRPVIRPATATTPAIMMGDDEYRALAQLQPEATADLGLTPGGYIYLVRTTFAAEIKDVVPIRRGGGRIELRLLGRAGDGSVDHDTIVRVARSFAPEDRTQLTDILSVASAEIAELHLSVTLVIPNGPDPAPVLAEARRGLDAYRASVHRLGMTVWREAVQAAAHVDPVLTVRVAGMGEELAGRLDAAPLVIIDHLDFEVVA